nr:MAG TPA: hypothetical protein [Caudoviricetes sp.]
MSCSHLPLLEDMYLWVVWLRFTFAFFVVISYNLCTDSRQS